MLAVLLLLTAPPSTITEDVVTIVEVNHVYSSDWGKVRFHQIIFWRMERRPNRETGQLEWDCYVADYRMTDLDDYHLSGKLGNYVFLLWDDKQGQIILRRIRSTTFMETWTNYDREVGDRWRLPITNRRGLTAR